MTLFFTKIFGQSWLEVLLKYYLKKITTQHHPVMILLGLETFLKALTLSKGHVSYGGTYLHYKH